MTIAIRRLPGLPEVLLLEPQVRRDERGWFAETYKESELRAHQIPPFVQENHVASLRAATVRGLHFQVPPAAQGKLVRCVRGEIHDVAVDLRPASPTYRRHATALLTESNHHALWIPAGFAHGLQTLTDGAEVLYKVTHEYSPAHERTVRWNDPDLAIKWPLARAILNPRDEAAPSLRDLEAALARA